MNEIPKRKGVTFSICGWSLTSFWLTEWDAYAISCRRWWMIMNNLYGCIKAKSCGQFASSCTCIGSVENKNTKKTKIGGHWFRRDDRIPIECCWPQWVSNSLCEMQMINLRRWSLCASYEIIINYQINTILSRLSSHRMYIKQIASNQLPTHGHSAALRMSINKTTLIYRRLSRRARAHTIARPSLHLWFPGFQGKIIASQHHHH